MSVPFNHADGARKNRDGDDLPNDVRRQKSAAARVNPQRDASAENLAEAKTSNWSGRLDAARHVIPGCQSLRCSDRWQPSASLGPRRIHGRSECVNCDSYKTFSPSEGPRGREPTSGSADPERAWHPPPAPSRGREAWTVEHRTPATIARFEPLR